MRMAHADFIEQLGDTGAVATALGQKDSAVSMWKRRGVPWRWRTTLADVAAAKGVAVPDGFLSPDQADFE